MEDETEIISSWLTVAGEIDEILQNFHALCLEQVVICRSINSTVIRERALEQTAVTFANALAAVRA